MGYGNAKSICTYYGDAELWKLHCNGVLTYFTGGKNEIYM